MRAHHAIQIPIHVRHLNIFKIWGFCELAILEERKRGDLVVGRIPGSIDLVSNTVSPFLPRR